MNILQYDPVTFPGPHVNCQLSINFLTLTQRYDMAVTQLCGKFQLPSQTFNLRDWIYTWAENEEDGGKRSYPFNYGDLTFSSRVLQNYLEDDLKAVPWDDLRYMFGEIIYGGHITDDWDKRLCQTYLQKLNI
uniref:Dynein heavy chain AAA lid domain-containing protein n=1 Tax=Phlebotomus papatasi TaxID=29031 RepID=A0A1B0DGP2_PHLPP